MMKSSFSCFTFKGNPKRKAQKPTSKVQLKYCLQLLFILFILSSTYSQAPIILTNTWNDQDRNGNIDQLVLTFDKDVNVIDGQGAVDGFSPITITGADVTFDFADYSSNNTTVLTLNFLNSEIEGTDPQSVSFIYSIQNAPLVLGIYEQVASLELTGETGTKVDGAIPQTIGASSFDTDGDGNIETVIVEFSEVIDENFAMQAVIEGGFSLSTDQTVLVFNLFVSDGSEDEFITMSIAPLANVSGTGISEVRYIFDVLNPLEDLNGNPLADTILNATDAASPVLIDTIPLNGAVDVGRVDEITLTFSEPIDMGEGNLQLVDLTDGTDNRIIPILPIIHGTNSVTFNPLGHLDGNKTYAIQVDGTVAQDASENIFAGINDSSYTFTTLPSYYWVGNGGDWSDLTHWVRSSGGTESHLSLPSYGDDVFFDANSFTEQGQTVTMDLTLGSCSSMDWSEATNIPDFRIGLQNELEVYGSVIFNPEMTFDNLGVLSLEASGNENFISHGKALGNVTQLGGGVYNILDSFLADSLVIDHGVLITNNNSVTILKDFYFNGAATYADFGQSIVTIGGNWIASASTNFNASAATFNMFSIGESELFQFSGNNTTYHTVSFSGNNTYSVNGNNNFNVLNLSDQVTVSLSNNSTQTVSSDIFLNGDSTTSPIRLQTAMEGSQATLQSNGTVFGNFATIQDINAVGSADFNVFNSIDLGNNSGWSFRQSQVLLNSSEVPMLTLAAGSIKSLVYKVQINSSFGSSTPEGFYMNYDGILNGVSFKLFRNSAGDDFSTASFLTDGVIGQGDTLPKGSIGFFFDEPIAENTTNYYYITADIPTNSLGGSFSFGLPSTDNFGFQNSAKIAGTFVEGEVFTYESASKDPVTAFEPTAINTSGFTANWSDFSVNVLNYHIDVSGSPDFSSFVGIYNDLAVVVATNVEISGLDYSSKYYYRVRVKFDDGTVSENSNVVAVTTATDPQTTLDSLALLSIYNNTKGPTWFNDQNWGTGRLRDWFGVTMNGTRVSRLMLGANNLNGGIPSIASGLGQLMELDLSDNFIVSISRPSDLQPGTEINLSNNFLQFDVLEGLVNQLTNITFSPQQPVLPAIDNLVEIGSTVLIDRSVNGSENSYRWFKDGEEIEQTGSSLELVVSSSEDEAIYHVEVTSATVSGLTLTTTEYVLKVSSLERDQEALLNIFEATGGVANWTNGADWPNNTDITTWVGVTVSNNRVTGLDLANAGLRGDMPIDLKDIPGLVSIDLSENRLTSLPDISGLENVLQLDVSGNRLDFGDLEPNVLIPGISYGNQGVVGKKVPPVLARRGTNTKVVANVGGEANIYSWSRRNATGTKEIGGTSNIVEIKSIDFGNMGEFTATITNSLVPNLTLTARPIEAYATAILNGNVTGVGGTGLSAGKVQALRIPLDGGAYDSLDLVTVTNGSFTMGELILGDFILGTRADSTVYLPTYFQSTDQWTQADTIQLREDFTIGNYAMQELPAPLTPADGSGEIGMTLESDFLDEDNKTFALARTEARRKVQRAGCSLRRRRRATGGKIEQDDDFELVVYKETDDEGRVTFENLPPDTYRLNIEYPGIPLDPASFIEFEVGAAGEDNGTLQLEATVSESGIVVEQVVALGLLSTYFHTFEIYPNPGDKEITVVFDRKRRNIIGVQLYDLNGRLFLTTELTNDIAKSQMLNVESIPSGTYVFRLVDYETGALDIASYRLMIFHP